MIIMLYTGIESQGETSSPYPVRSRRAEELTRLPASGPQSLLSPPGNAVTIIVVCGLTKSVPFWKQTLSLGQYALFGCPKVIGFFVLPNYQVLVPNHQPATLSSPHRCFSSFCPVIKVHRILFSLHFLSAKSGHTPSSSTLMEQCPMIASLAGVCIFGHRSSFSEPGYGFLRVTHFFCIFLFIVPACWAWSQDIWQSLGWNQLKLRVAVSVLGYDLSTISVLFQADVSCNMAQGGDTGTLWPCLLDKGRFLEGFFFISKSLKIGWRTLNFWIPLCFCWATS